jgi:hypothetical protein
MKTVKLLGHEFHISGPGYYWQLARMSIIRLICGKDMAVMYKMNLKDGINLDENKRRVFIYNCKFTGTHPVPKKTNIFSRILRLFKRKKN